MADQQDQDQKLDSIKLRVEKEKAEREAAGLPSPPLSSPTYSASHPVTDPEETIGDPNATEHEWLEAAHSLNREEQKKETEREKKEKRDSAFENKFLIVFLSMIIILAGAALGNVFFNPSPPPAIQEYVPPAQAPAKDIDFKPYMDALQKSIKSHWKAPPGDHVVKVKFKVHRNGEISDLAFDRMSRSPEKDAAVIKAIVESMPSLPPLPEGSPENVDIQFTFESHTYDSPAPAHDAPEQH